MNIIVCIKQVPDTAEVKIDPATNNLVRDGVPSIMNPYDEAALSKAIQLRESIGGSVTVVSMGPDQAKRELLKGIAMGADKAYLLCDKRLGGADTLATGYTLAALADTIGYDLIICGNEAVDGCTGQVGPCMGEHLGIPVFTYVNDVKIKEQMIRVQRDTGKAIDEYETDLPVVICMSGKEHTENSYKLKDADSKLQVLNADFLNKDMIGINGSPTRVADISIKEKQKKYMGVDYRWSCEKRIAYIMNGGLEKKKSRFVRGNTKEQVKVLLDEIMRK